MSGDVKEQLPPVADPLLQHIKQFIQHKYEPALSPADATMRLSTMELMQAVYRIYPNPPLEPSDLALWMHELGFIFWDAGNMRWEWLIKEAA